MSTAPAKKAPPVPNARPVKTANIPEAPAVDPVAETDAPDIPAPAANMYKNLHKTNIFAEAGRCKPGECIALTPHEVEVFGDLVKPA